MVKESIIPYGAFVYWRKDYKSTAYVTGEHALFPVPLPFFEAPIGCRSLPPVPLRFFEVTDSGARLAMAHALNEQLSLKSGFVIEHG